MLLEILIFILGLIILHRIKKIWGQRACPDAETLKDYFEGRLKKQDIDEYERVIGHLGICEKCQTRLTDLASFEGEADEGEQ